MIPAVKANLVGDSTPLEAKRQLLSSKCAMDRSLEWFSGVGAGTFDVLKRRTLIFLAPACLCNCP